jgi:TonB family protein
LFYEGEFKEEWKLGGNTALPILDCSLTELMSGFTINDEAWSIPSMEGLSESVESWVEVEAEFNGGFEGLNQFIKDNIRPPAEAVELGVNGQVIVRFVVEKDGTVSNAVVETKLVECPACDREALRVVTRMPKWKPGSLAGREVRTFVRLPINFNTY